jgi:hypothetical protein
MYARKRVLLALALCGLWGSQTSAEKANLSSLVDALANHHQSLAKDQVLVNQKVDQQSELSSQYQQVQEQIDAIKAYHQHVQAMLHSQQEEMKSLEQQMQGASRLSRQLNPLMEDMVAALKAFVDLDTPFLVQERHERTQRLDNTLKKTDISVAEKFRQVLEAYLVENDYGRTIEAYRGELSEGKGLRNVDFLRIGRLLLVYQSLDRTQWGVWHPHERRWKSLPSSYANAINRGLKIARKQVPPDLLILPLFQKGEDS